MNCQKCNSKMVPTRKLFGTNSAFSVRGRVFNGSFLLCGFNNSCGNKQISSKRRDPSEKVVMVWTYLQKNNSQCDKTCSYNESTGKKNRQTKIHMATKCGVRDEGNEPFMGMVGMTSPRQFFQGLLWVAYAHVKERKGIDLFNH
jgi:hypothetical protein